MSDPNDSTDYKYWAFISYSHRDRRWGDWLHRALETYRVPRHLVGQPARHGVVPKRAFPIFRDREELPGSADLGDNINHALEQSRYLVVICSPRSAQSRWVGEEIKQFKALGRENRVLCLIVDGEPNASDRAELDDEECFPEAVRFRVDAGGAITDERTEPIAADARKGKDGRLNAKLKLLAGLLGVDYDALKQRDQARRLRRLQIITAAAAVLVATLAFLSVGFYHAKVEAEHAREAADKAREIAEEERRRALDNLRESHNHRGFNALYDGQPDRALFFLNEARRIEPTQKFTRHAIADAWQRVRSVETRLPGEEERIRALEFTADGKRLAVQDAVGRVRLYDRASGERLLATAGRIQTIPSAVVGSRASAIVGFQSLPSASDPDRLDRAIVRHDANGQASGAAVPWPAGWSDVDMLALSPSGRFLLYHVANVGVDEVARIHDFDRPGSPDVAIELTEPFRSSIWSFSADDRFVLRNRYAGTGPFSVVVHDRRGQEVARLAASSRIESTAVHGSRVALGDANGAVAVFDLDRPGEHLWRDGELHRGSVSTLAFDAAGARLLSTDSLGGVAVRDASEGTAIWQRAASEHGVIAAGALSADGGRVAVGYERTVVVYHLDPGTRLMRDWHEAAIEALAFSPDGNRLAAGLENGSVTLWRVDTRDPERSIPVELPSGERFAGVRRLEPGAYLVRGQATYLADLASARVNKLADGPQSMTLALRDRLVAIGYWGQTQVLVLDASGQPESSNLLEHTGEARFAVPPTGSGVSLIVAMPGSRVVAIDAKTQTLPGEIPVPAGTGDAWSIQFDGSGRRGFVNFADGQLLEFSIEGNGLGDPVWHRPIAGGATPRLIDVSHEGTHVLLGQDARVHVYSLAGRQAVSLGRAGLVAARFVGAPQPPRIAAVDASGDLSVWSVNGDRGAQGTVPDIATAALSLAPAAARPGRGIAMVNEESVATSVDDRVYLWRLSDGRLLWRSPRLAAQGSTPTIDILAAERDGAELVVTVAEGGLAGSIDRLVRVPIPGVAAQWPEPSIVEVDAHTMGPLGFDYRDGWLLSRIR